jgi:hypothetical protein
MAEAAARKQVRCPPLVSVISMAPNARHHRCRAAGRGGGGASPRGRRHQPQVAAAAAGRALGGKPTAPARPRSHALTRVSPQPSRGLQEQQVPRVSARRSSGPHAVWQAERARLEAESRRIHQEEMKRREVHTALPR